MKLKLYSWRCLLSALAYAAVGVSQYFHSDEVFGRPWQRYAWLLFLLPAGLFLFRAFSPAQRKPAPEDEQPS